MPNSSPSQSAPAFTATPVSQFGKDHWSLLAYVESCCVDGSEGVGRLFPSRMRGNPATHPLLAHLPASAWKLTYSTRLQGFFDYEHRSDAAKAIEAGWMLANHDDWDCLNDLEAAGYVEVLSLGNPAVRMTELGQEVAGKLRAHKALGGQFAQFSLTPVAA